LEGTIEVSC